ncbi:MAG: TonB-dependent receptor plug domain-containing protein [Proteobacteria bacterium]|nr:TonB-dependent receptor plug domain-containing protein [Pseudomonadota bacterium]
MHFTLTRIKNTAMRILAILVLSSFSSIGFSQDNVGDESTVVYPAAYFAEFAPVTAQDMLDRIPGVGTPTGGPSFGGGGRPRGVIFGRGPAGGGRGFGGGQSGGNEILINGKRTAGKTNNTSGQLDRIAADQVEYIELIRGTSGDLDVRGSGQVINVVLFEEISSTSISYEVSMERYLDHATEPGGSLSVSGQAGELSYVINATVTAGYDHSVSKENSVLGDFSPNDIIREDRITDQTTYELSANLNYRFNARSSARFNAQFIENDNPFEITRSTTDLRVSPNALSREREDVPGKLDNWEIGGDYEYLTPAGNRFKLLFISNEANASSTRERFKLFADGTEEKDLFLDTASVTQERIIRGSYTFDIFDNQDIEIGAERAQTILDSNLALGTADATGTPSSAVGGLVPVEVANANSKVEEIRYEPFVIHNWIINSRMSLESTLLYETSEIRQSGDVSNKRDFDFVKPKLDFRFDLTPQLQLRASIEKVVNQLSFADFVAANDDQDDDSNTQAGNENLKQEWFWQYVFNAEYRLPNDIGVVDGGIFYHQHHDVIERIDVTTDADELSSANGNIGDGDMWGMNLNASIRMHMINMPNLLLTATLRVTDSSITDPFLGIDRRFQFQARGFNSFGFRHDIPSWNMNWGLQWLNRHDNNIKRYDIDDIELAAGDPTAFMFAEYIDSRGITYRLDANAFTNDVSCRERQRFVGRISSGILEEIEDRCTGSGRTLSFKVTGTF